MKNRLSGLILAALLLSLCACGGQGSAAPREFVPGEDARTLLDSGAFSEVLTQIDTEAACSRYGIDFSTVTAGEVYGSTGVTAEELAVFTFDSADHAADASKALGYWLEDRIGSLSSYQPQEVSKLNDAVLETRGASLLLAVAADYGPVDQLLDQPGA